MNGSRSSQPAARPTGPGVPWAGLADMPPLAVSLGNTLWNRTGSWRYQRPLYREATAPCSEACPAGEDVRAYVQLIAQGQYAAALAKIREENPLPGVCGRVCYHPCETACSRSLLDGALAIHALERFAGEQDLLPVQPVERRPQPVAVVGAGPAGLSCAFHLARRGYPVRVYDAQSQPGGMLRVGIPAYRLPRAVLDREVEAIAALGVSFHPGVRVGRDVGLAELQAQCAAIFLAPGAHRSRRLGIAGEEAAGVVSGLALLADLAAGRLASVPERVIVVGGGNTAVDVARSLRRLGARPTIAYRRAAAEMPAIAEEVQEAIAEGVELTYLVAPQRVLVDAGRAVGVECARLQLGAPDASGRRQPLPAGGPAVILAADLVVRAIGEDPDLDFVPPQWQQNGQIGADQQGARPAPGVFAGGDAASGRGRVADAIGSGKQAALAIHHYLTGGAAAAARPPVAPAASMNLDYFTPQARVALPRLAASDRLRDFAEVNLGLAAAAAAAEAARCFTCGLCTRCDNCWIFCPDATIARTADGYAVDYEHCKGCGLCAQECPRAAMVLEEESLWRE